uniref:non-specific serine/threonine protein kinase n=1 Tax=Romanomermis culicivorax TaxID=13658 RepID=A0A915LE04_ROMCU
MQLVGHSLSYYRKRSPPLTNGLYKFSSRSIVRFGVQCVEALEEFHDIQFIHRDIKPSNFVMGLSATPNKDIVYLLDFGLSRKYLDSEGKHRAPRATAPFRGSIRYCSVDAWERNDLGRKDDVESLFYMLYESWAGTLPWAKLSKNSPTEENVSLRKSILAQPVAAPRDFERFGKHIKELSFDSKPNYDQLKSILIDIGAANNLKPSDLWDWENSYQYVLEEYASGRTFEHGKITTTVETNSSKKSPNVVSPMNRQWTTPTSKVAGVELAFNALTNENGTQQLPGLSTQS